MTSEENASATGGSSQKQEPQAGGHSDKGFQQLGGDETVDPGATDTGIGGTGGVDGATLGGLRNEEAPHIVPPEGSDR
jgi:hypothetical protein